MAFLVQFIFMVLLIVVGACAAIHVAALEVYLWFRRLGTQAKSESFDKADSKT
jgi:hypothetical protein